MGIATIKGKFSANTGANTKDKIIQASVILFSEYGFYRVSTRDIANAVDIRPASLYSHFAAKEDILASIYALYEEKRNKVLPDLNSLMKLAETDPPMEVLAKANFWFEPEDQETMDRITTIAAVESRTDKRSADFLTNNILNLPLEYGAPLLSRMLELGRIEPLDIDAFTTLLSNFCFSAAIRNFTQNPVTMDEWMQGTSLLYQMVKPTGK
jgi:AcrR family transcriptional regulator